MNKVIFHIRIILGGGVMAVALSYLFLSLNFYALKLESNLLFIFVMISILSVGLSAFAISKWSKGNGLHGAIIGYLWTWGMIFVEREFIQIVARGGVENILIVFIISPLPLVFVGFIFGSIGKNSRKAKLLLANKPTP